MIFAVLTLISALSISCIAAYFSIIGLATIFPGSIEAVIAMGAALEVGKIIAAIWLHNNWSSAPRMIKIYLFSAILVLMGITSMGIFGFLSKSHIEHQNHAEKNIALSSQVETKITREREFIERQKDLIQQTENSNKNLSDKSQENIKLEQEKIDQLNIQLEKDIALDSKMLLPIQSRIDELNKELNEVRNKPGGLFSNKTKEIEKITTEQAQERGELSIKKSDIELRISKYRNETSTLISDIRKRIREYQSIGFEKPDDAKNKIEEYNNKISISLDRIDELEKEKFNYDDGSRQLEAEVGPIKYVAELISDFTGVEFDIGKAVRIVIIILIFVFDPLAVLLVLAAHISLMKRFPGLEVNESDIIVKKSKIKILSKELEDQERELSEKKKDLEQEEKIIELKESQVNLYKQQIEKYKESSRRAKIDAEKRVIELEKHLPIKEEIESLYEKKQNAKEELQQIKSSKKKVLEKADEFKKDISEIKKIALKRKENEELISSSKSAISIFSSEIDVLKKSLADLTKTESNRSEYINELRKQMDKQEDRIRDLVDQNDQIKKEKQNLDKEAQDLKELMKSEMEILKQKEASLKEIYDSKNQLVITKGNLNNSYYAIIPSSIGGAHKFTKLTDFSQTDILNYQSVAKEIEEKSLDNNPDTMCKTFESIIKKYLNPKLDNRSYRENKPSYEFIS
jgi:chromosome segregation ATPase